MKLLSSTQSRVLELLKKNLELSVDQISDHLQVAKTAVRRHLLAMERRGLLQRHFRAAQRGRPILTFSLTAKSKYLFPSKEAEILNDLLNFLSQKNQDEFLEEFFEGYWEKRLKSVMSRIRKKDENNLEARLQALKEVLEEDGFMPDTHIDKKHDEIMLRQCHCPLEAASQFSTLPCRLEQRLIAKVLNAPVSSLTLRSDNNPVCEFRLPLSKARRSFRS